MKSSRQTFRPHWQAQLTDYITAIVATERLIAATSAAGEIAAWDWKTGDCLWRDRLDCPLSGAAFSTDGAWLAAVGQQGCVRVWATADFAAPPQVVPVPASVWVDRLAWDPGSQHLALNVNRSISIWDAAKQSAIAELDFADSSVLGLAWHPHGTHLAACGHTGTKVWDARAWTKDPYLLRVPGASLDAAWSPNGIFLAAGNFDRTLSILQWDSPPPWLMQGFPAKVRQVAWAANSQSLAAVCAEGIAIWHWERQTWKNQRVLQGHTSSVRAVSFQESQLASAGDDGRVCLWQGVKKLMQTLKGPAPGCTSLVWHPEGTAIAVGGCDGEVCLWQRSPIARGFG
ncbi:MAG: WD40 repeat domain-containing protein [Cyanobacteria bacterium J06641_5]